MDTQNVIELTGQAADSVLRFRTVAFTPRPVLDVKSFKATIATQIRKVAREEDNRFETPLTDVVRYAGMAASRAAQGWNKVSEKENHIDREWFRNCVCDLVSGAVNDIGQKAFQYNDLNASEYLEPEDYDPFDVTTYQTTTTDSRRSSNTNSNSLPSSPSSENVGLAYYGFARRATPHQPSLRVEGVAFGGDEDATGITTPRMPLHHEVNMGWRAIHGLAAAHASGDNNNDSAARFIEATLPLRRKRGGGGTSREDSETDDPDLLVSKRRRNKRVRSSGSSPTSAAFPGVGPVGIGEGGMVGGTKKKVVKMSWTEEEVEMLFKGREEGKDWDMIHAVLPRHTRCACQKKYRDVSKQREKREMSVAVQDENLVVSSPSSGFQGDAEDDVMVDEEEVLE